VGSLAGRQKKFNELVLFALRNGFGVFSLSEAPDNPLMWGHYADNFRGLCIGFDAVHWFFSNDQNIYGSYRGDKFQRDVAIVERDTYDIVQPVFYSTMRPQFDMFNAYFLNAFLIKSTEWMYEKEWRMIRSISECSENESNLRILKDERSKYYPDLDGRYRSGSIHKWPELGLCDFPLDAVREIIIGPLASPEFSGRVEGVAKKVVPHADLRRAKLHPMDYKVVLDNKINLAASRRPKRRT
jgi:hypothetical protein